MNDICVFGSSTKASPIHCLMPTFISTSFSTTTILKEVKIKINLFMN